jgi:hypothetical protein
VRPQHRVHQQRAVEKRRIRRAFPLGLHALKSSLAASAAKG